MRSISGLLAVLGLCAAWPSATPAQTLIGSYIAVIGEDDLYNSDGARLGQPWQVLRQDRANFHRFRIRQEGDESDPFFGDANNRAAMERMVMNGRIERSAARRIVAGGAVVRVQIFGQGGRGTSVLVEVLN